MKRELKDVLHYYLPHKLNVIWEINGPTHSFILTTGIYHDHMNNDRYRVKPILCPLSDAIDELSDFIYDTQPESFDSLENANHWFKIIMHYPSELPFEIFEKALSLHCDLFGLIESGQAIEKTKK